jgi:valyl-tRNA synthetase
VSKSKGNAVTPADLLRDHGTDAVRYWALSARLGVDTAFELAQIKVGRRLAIKILNAGRFVLSLGPPAAAPVTEPIDRAFVLRLAAVAEQCTAALEAYDHAAALEHAERFFWFFCDNYLELVKARGYGEHGPAGAASAQATLQLGLSVLVRLLAPYLPFVTEEVWSWWQDGSVHRSRWPDAAELREQAGPGDETVLATAAAAITAIRTAKSGARLSMREPVLGLILTADPATVDALAAASADVRAAGKVAELTLHPVAGAEPDYRVVLG